MKNTTYLAFLALSALPAVAAAQESPRAWSDLAESRAAAAFQETGPRGRGGQVTEEWYSPHMRGSLAFYGRASFPGDDDVTIDHVQYSDLFDVGLGISVEGDLLTYFTPHWAVGGYLSVGWDRFSGQTVDFPTGDSVKPNHMDLTTVLVGGKVLQRVTPFLTWEGRMGLGVVHYSSVLWSGFDSISGPFADEQLFRPINRGVFEIGGRIGFGNPHIEGDFGFGVRIMGGAARGRDVTTAIDPDILTTFMLELGLTMRF